MNTEQVGLSDKEKSELEARLNKFAKQDMNSVILVSSRCALRVFPLLAKPLSDGFLSYWPDEIRIKYLLEAWRALLFSAPQMSNSISYRTDYFKADQIFSTINSSALKAKYTNFEVASALYAIADAFHSYCKPNSTIQASIRAIEFASNIETPTLSRLLDQELILLEMNGLQSLDDLSLWINERLSGHYLDMVDKYLPEGLSQLAEQSRESDTVGAGIIDEIYPIYRDIYEGKPNRKRIAKALKQLESYFSQDQQDQSKLTKESDDIKLTGGIANDVDFGAKQELEEVRHQHSLSQNEDNHAKEDKLNRAELVVTLADMLSDESNSHHQTIGLLGDWGSGKSSIIAQLKEALLSNKDEQPFLFAEFNAWEYEHTDNIQAGIAQEMVKTLTTREPRTEQRQCWFFCKLSNWLRWKFYRATLTCRFAWRIQGFKLIYTLLLLVGTLLPIFTPILELWPFSYVAKNLLGGVDEKVKSLFPVAWVVGAGYPLWLQAKKVFAEPLAKELRTYLKLPDYAKHLGMIPVMQDHIKKLVDVRLNTSKPKKRLLYVVDDLDRCSHEGIVKVLEAVRLVLGLKNVTVIIAVDQRIAMAALALHYQELELYHAKGDARQIARDYLAKIIHFPIQLTKPDQASVSGYLASLWQHDTVEEILDKRPTDKTIGTEPDKELPVPSAPDLVKEPRNPIDDERNETLGDNDVEKKITVIKRLSPAQQEAFKHWVLYFDLTNPRQLKRLNNSYIFLLNYHKNDELPDRSASVHSPVESGFPILAILCALEYLNDLDDRELRHALKQQLEIAGGSSSILKEDKEKRDSSKITESVIALAGTNFNTQTGSTTAYKAVEPFVLPALDSDPASAGS